VASRTGLRIDRRGLAIVLGVLVVAILATVYIGSRANQATERVDPCTTPPNVVTRHGVTLRPDAMAAFRQAQRAAKGSIEVVSSYRTCAQQRLTCQRICGNPEGCPGTCVKPGFSYHQLGAAIDVTQKTLDTPSAVTALVAAGWCQAVPRTDPGHFSFGGCH
jgi:D-alanyl-D-alanine carboxypeptidase-like protein